jgi:hypothetical protein
MKIKIHSSENLKDILYIYKRIRCIIDYVCMSFINVGTLSMVQYNTPTGAKDYIVCEVATGCPINLKVSVA